MTSGKMMNGIHSYQELLAAYVPRPIHNEIQYNATVAQMNELIDKGDLTEPEQELLTLIGALVMTYEDEHYPDEQFELRGVELLQALMAETNLSLDDLRPVFRSTTVAARVLEGTLNLTLQNAIYLSTYFGLPQELFLPITETEPA